MTLLVPWQLGHAPTSPFPPADTALREPDGLLAIGGDLHPARLLAAYRHGIFPWSNPGEPLLWWSPDPRTVFDTAAFRLSRGNRRALRQTGWQVRMDTAFDQVIACCADMPRSGQHGTWIDSRMQAAYQQLHRLGHAHSVEVYQQDELIGGLYGVAVGHMFFGESMYSARPGASKLALAAACHWLARWDMPLFDAQVHNPHLALLGARSMPRHAFLAKVSELAGQPATAGSWCTRAGVLDAAALAA